MLKKKCDSNIQKTLDLAEEMILLAQRGDDEREDTGCGILYGVLRDSGFKIKQLALKEKEAHINKGMWREESCKPQEEKKRPGRLTSTARPLSAANFISDD